MVRVSKLTRIDDPSVIVGARVVSVSEDEIILEKDGERYAVYPVSILIQCYDEDYREASVECDWEEYFTFWRLEEYKSLDELVSKMRGEKHG